MTNSYTLKSCCTAVPFKILTHADNPHTHHDKGEVNLLRSKPGGRRAFGVHTVATVICVVPHLLVMGSIISLIYLESTSHAAAAGGEAIFIFFGVFANFYTIEISYLLGPISPHDLEISYLPAGVQFLSLHLVLYCMCIVSVRVGTCTCVACWLVLGFGNAGIL